MACHKTEGSEVNGIILFELDKSGAGGPDLVVTRLPDGLVRLPSLDLVPGELTIAVLQKNIFVLLAEYFCDILRVIEHHARDDGGPCPLKPIPARGLVSGIIRSDGLV